MKIGAVVWDAVRNCNFRYSVSITELNINESKDEETKISNNSVINRELQPRFREGQPG